LKFRNFKFAAKIEIPATEENKEMAAAKVPGKCTNALLNETGGHFRKFLQASSLSTCVSWVPYFRKQLQVFIESFPHHKRECWCTSCTFEMRNFPKLDILSEN
jgi:hypothetical protein